MQIAEILRQMTAKGIGLQVENGHLSVKAPRGVMTAEMLELLKENKQAVMEAVTKKQLYASYAPIPCAPRQEHYPLSNSQKRIWIVCQFEKANVAYNLHFAFRLTGTLDKTCLQEAFKLVIKRHESLRTAFCVVQGVPVQRILPAADHCFRLVEEDISRVANPGQELQSIVEREMQYGFDLSSGYLLRVVFVRETAGSVVLFFSLHHIITDDMSMNVFMHDLSSYYRGLCAGVPAALPPLAIQYKDYACWQNAHNELMEVDLNYWKHKLAGYEGRLNLPVDKYPAGPTYNGGLQPFSFDKDLLEAIRQQCGIHHTTLFTYLFSLVKLLLFKYTGQTDIVISIPVLGRSHPMLEGQIGCYINTLPIRTTFQEEDSVSQFIAKVKKSAEEAFEHQHCPFEYIMEEYRRTTAQAGSLLEVMILFRDHRELAAVGDQAPQGLTITQMGVQESSSKVPLAFNFNLMEASLSCSIEYNSDFFTIESIDRIIGHFKALTVQVVVNDTSIDAIEYMTAEEKALLLSGFAFSTT